MNVVFLFNSNYPAYQKEWNYFWPARRLILKASIIQASNRHMKLGAGDVILDVPRSEQAQIREVVFFNPSWGLIHRDRLESVFDQANILAVVFYNMTKPIAERLHRRLSRSGGYLGAMEIDFAFPPHLVVFRNLIGTSYRIKGTMIRKFYSMGSNEDPDESDLADLKKLGFTDVGYEDQGLRGTIFDDYDKPAHFRQIKRLQTVLSANLTGGADDASEMVMELEDLNPQLFNALGAAIDAVERAEHEEHIAQAALSGRRFIEKLADTLFPPRTKPHNGRDVGPDRYRNRLWAYIADNVPASGPRIKKLGQEVDRLSEELNGGVHGDRPKERILTALVDAAKLTMSLLMLNPDAARQAYEPFMAGFKRFFLEVEKDRGSRTKMTKRSKNSK